MSNILATKTKERLRDLVLVFKTITALILLQESPAPPAQLYYPSPNVSRPASQLTEEEQIKIAQRIGLIQHLPTGTYDGCKKNRE